MSSSFSFYLSLFFFLPNYPTDIPFWSPSSLLQAPSRLKEWSGVDLVVMGVMDGIEGRYFVSISLERIQISLSGLLYRFRTNRTLKTTPGATHEVRWLSRYALDSKFPPSPAHFASPSGYTRRLGSWTLFLESPQ